MISLHPEAPAPRSLSRPLALPLCAVFLVAFSARGEKIAFAPEKGSSVTKTYGTQVEMVLDDLSLILDGQDVGGMLGALELTLEHASKVVVTDEYGATEEGRPLKLSRTFDTLAGNFDFSANSDAGGEQQTVSSTSALEGETVIFTWDKEASDYDVSFPGEGDTDLLEGLVEDMDLRVMLPKSEVAVGDEWKVEIQALSNLIAPGGNLHLLPENVEESEVDMSMVEDLFGQDFVEGLKDLYQGECKCTFKGTRDLDGKKVAEIGFEIEVSSAADLSDMLVDLIEKAGSQFGGEMPELDIETADFNLDLEGSGTLLWDLGAGRLHGLDLTGEMIVAVDIAISVEAEGESHSAEVSVEFSGGFSETVETDD